MRLFKKRSFGLDDFFILPGAVRLSRRVVLPSSFSANTNVSRWVLWPTCRSILFLRLKAAWESTSTTVHTLKSTGSRA